MVRLFGQIVDVLFADSANWLFTNGTMEDSSVRITVQEVRGGGVAVGKMSGEELANVQATHPFVAEDLCHLLVGNEEVLVLRVLKVVLLQIGPQLLDALSPGGFLFANEFSQISREFHGLSQTGPFSRHGEIVRSGVVKVRNVSGRIKIVHHSRWE